jgi:hypothetical protein
MLFDDVNTVKPSLSGSIWRFFSSFTAVEMAERDGIDTSGFVH